MTLSRDVIPSPNKSSRGGAAVRLIVVHDTEGALTYKTLGGFFANPASQVSSHVGIDDTPGRIGEYVRRGDKAWTAANANPVAVQAELCAPSGAAASWTAADWHKHPNMLANAAAWIAEEAAAFGLPIVRLTPSQAQGGGRGVCQHSDLGAWGGGHHDCGPGFPINDVIAMALGGHPAPPPAGGGGQAPPPFPYPGSNYIGTARPDPACHSGCYGPPDSDQTARWQRQMSDRGWSISVDGCYGAQSEGVCRQFQAEKSLAPDGLVGPQTWAASWTAPVT